MTNYYNCDDNYFVDFIRYRYLVHKLILPNVVYLKENTILHWYVPLDDCKAS